MKSKNYKRNILGLMVLASLIGGTTGCTKNQDNNQNNNIEYDEIISEALQEYEQKRNELEKEINKLKKQKEELENENIFDLKELILGEIEENDGSKELYIFKYSHNGGIVYEIHEDFNAWINFHSLSKEHYDFCAEYYHLQQEDTSLLALSLTDEELEKININGGKITTSEADKILERLRKEYHSSSKLELKN